MISFSFHHPRQQYSIGWWHTERPDAPSKALVTRVESRSVIISWSPPYSGNSPILHYIVEYKEVGDEWSSPNTKIQRIPGSESRATISSLWPGIAYHIRLYAENSIGKSEGGPILHAITEIEIPSEAPSEVIAENIGSRAIKVSWRPPYSYRSHSSSSSSLKSNNHLIKGYYIGFKPVHSPNSAFSYKTFDVEESSLKGVIPLDQQHHPQQQSKFKKDSSALSSFETVIPNLEKMTKYVVIVKAFNRKGSGPPSDEIYVKTSDIGKYIYPFQFFGTSFQSTLECLFILVLFWHKNLFLKVDEKTHQMSIGNLSWKGWWGLNEHSLP